MFTMIHYGMSREFSTALDIFEIVFVVIFLMEAVLKITAYGFPDYWQVAWNKFDFVLVWFGILGVIMKRTLKETGGIGLNVFRLFRIARAFRLVSRLETLRMLFTTLIFSLEHSVWIATLVFIVITWFVFSGMILFGHVDRKNHDFNSLNSKVNFETPSNAYLTLYRLAHKDSWGLIYEDYIVGTSQSRATMYFVTYFLIVVVILFDLFIAIVLEMFALNLDRQQDYTKLVKGGIHYFREKWMEEDIERNGRMTAERFLHVLLKVPRRIGFARHGKNSKTPNLLATQANSFRVGKVRKDVTERSLEWLEINKDAVLKRLQKLQIYVLKIPSKKEQNNPFLTTRLNVLEDSPWMVKYEDCLFGIKHLLDKKYDFEIEEPTLTSWHISYWFDKNFIHTGMKSPR
eukprot:UN30250